MKETKQPFTLSERIDLLAASQETLLGILKDTLKFPGMIRDEMRARFREAEATLMNAKFPSEPPEPQWKAEIVVNESRLEDSVILEEFEKYMYADKEVPPKGFNYLFALPLSGITERPRRKLFNGKFSPNVILNIT